MDTKLAVIGIGYVGLPLARAATTAGLSVVGVDMNKVVVDALNEGRSHVDDVSDSDVAAMLRAGFRATSDESILSQMDVVVICVPTPLDESGGPELSAVIAATKAISRNLQPDQLVVLESTTYPGTTEDVVRPLLETESRTAGDDFFLAFSPERIDPGNPTFGIHNTTKVVGGVNERSTDAAAAFYESFIEDVHRTKGTREAELAKLLENTYRHVNIALINEMAVFSNDLGVDIWASIEAAKTKPFGFQAFYPGPGVGGHCIPIDPNYLSYKVRTLGYPFRFVELAQEINDRMPAYVVGRAMVMLNGRGKPVMGAKVLLLGVTYKKNIADERESPARAVARRLLDLGADLSYADPFVHSWTVADSQVKRVDDPADAVNNVDIVILLQDHDEFDLEGIARKSDLLFDTRGAVDASQAERL